MPKTYIAFIECTFYDNPEWVEHEAFNDPEESTHLSDTREQYIAQGDGARLSLVDLGCKRRNFIFNKHGVVEIIGNVAVIVEWHLKEPPIDEYQ